MPSVVSRGRGRRTISEINMVPFIDVMLVLLIIFMVTAPLIAPSMIDLPSVGKGARQPDQIVQIVIGKDESLELRAGSTTRKLGPREVADAVKAAQTGQTSSAVVISADRSVRYETVVKVMDTLQRAGVQRVGLSVQLAPEPHIAAAQTMYAATASADWAEFAPPQPRTEPRALALALIAHGLLLAALAWGVNWRQTDNTLTVEAELWSAIPQQAAPRLETPPPPPPEPAPAPVVKPAPPPPPPPPDLAQRDADIALARQKQEAEALAAKQKLELEQKRRLKLEAEQKEAQKRALEQKRLAQEKLERDRLKQAADAKKAAQAKAAQEAQRREAAKLEAQKKDEEARAEKELKAQREANLRRMAGLAGASGGETATGTAQRSAGPSASYAGKVAARVRPNIVFTEDIAGNPTAEVEVRTSPDGSILSRKLVKSSGTKAWDEAVIKAIDKTDKLPLDTDGRVPSALVISFRPRD